MLTKALLGSIFVCSLLGQSNPESPGAKLVLVPSEPLTELKIPKAEGSPVDSKQDQQVRAAILNLVPASDPIYLIEEKPEDARDQWRTYRRPKVDPISRNGEGVALQGYDVISYLEEHPERGRKDYFVDFGGVKWQFSSIEHQRLFRENPDRYIPEYGGFCAYSVSKGYPATADPRVYAVAGRKLYLFFDGAVRAVWEQDRQKSILNADRNWPKLHR